VTTKIPTRTQAEIIRYFNGGPVPSVRSTQATYRACERNGWIEPIDVSPFYRTTNPGRLALDAYDNRVPLKPGRPRQHNRKIQVVTEVDQPVFDRIEAARGGLSRPEWLRQVINAALAA